MSDLFGGDNYRAYNHARRTTFWNLKWLVAGWRVLDLGCGDGFFGDSVFTPMGAILTCVDGRAEHIDALKRDRPHLAARAMACDLDNDFPSVYPGKWDLVFACGLLYHLGEPIKFLRNCASAAPLLFMETVVWNSKGDDFHFWDEESFRYDQSLNGPGARVTPEWLDRTLKEVGYTQVFEPPIPDHKDFRIWEQPQTARVLRIAARDGALPPTSTHLREL